MSGSTESGYHLHVCPDGIGPRQQGEDVILLAQRTIETTCDIVGADDDDENDVTTIGVGGGGAGGVLVTTTRFTASAITFLCGYPCRMRGP
jgi:hypothetical protein